MLFYWILLYFSILKVTQSYECPTSDLYTPFQYVLAGPDNKICYEFFLNGDNYWDAKKRCEKQASLQSINEGRCFLGTHVFVKETEEGNYFLGLTKLLFIYKSMNFRSY